MHSLSTFLQAHPEMSTSVHAELADHMIITAAQLGHMELLECLLALGGNVDVCCSERCGRGMDRGTPGHRVQPGGGGAMSAGVAVRCGASGWDRSLQRGDCSGSAS